MYPYINGLKKKITLFCIQVQKKTWPNYLQYKASENQEELELPYPDNYYRL